MSGKRKQNSFTICDDYVCMELNNGFKTLVDLEDLSRLSKYRWYAAKANGNFYVRATMETKKSMAMHRFLMNLDDRDRFIDHIDGNTLDNRKSNLRVCNNQENCRNRGVAQKTISGFKGVTPVKGSSKWLTQIVVDGKVKYGGRFLTAIEAAKKYNELAVKYFGEFARLNKIPINGPTHLRQSDVQGTQDQADHVAQMISYRILSEVERLCDEKGINRKELAEKLRTSASYITQLFRGHRRINMDLIAKIEGILEIQFEIKAVRKTEHKTFITL